MRYAVPSVRALCSTAQPVLNCSETLGGIDMYKLVGERTGGARGIYYSHDKPPSGWAPR